MNNRDDRRAQDRRTPERRRNPGGGMTALRWTLGAGLIIAAIVLVWPLVSG